MTEHYKTKLIEMLDKLSEKALKRLYQLAEYLYIYKEKGGRMSKDHHEPPTSRSDTMKKLDEILLNTNEILNTLKIITSESEVNNGRLKGII